MSLEEKQPKRVGRSREGLGCFLSGVERRKVVCTGRTHLTRCPINLRSAFWALDGFRPVRQVGWTSQVERNSVPTLHSEPWMPLLWVPDLLVDVNCSCSPFTRDSPCFMGCPSLQQGAPLFPHHLKRQMKGQKKVHKV